MTFSTAWAILQKFKTESGKPLSSRVVRGSKITHSRGLDISEQERRDLAASMSHSVETAERYYNYKDLKDSVAKSMRVAVRTSTEFSDNTESEEFIDVNSCSLTNFYSSTPLKIKKKTSKRQFSESFETTPKLTANLEDTCHTDESLNVPELSGICSSHDSTKTGQSSRMCPNETVNKTLKNLRSKKIKYSESTKSEKENQRLILSENVKKIINSANPSELYTSKNKICVQVVTKKLPKSVLKMFSVKEIRDIMIKVLDHGEN